MQKLPSAQPRPLEKPFCSSIPISFNSHLEPHNHDQMIYVSQPVFSNRKNMFVTPFFTWVLKEIGT
jgi:hypothetical protein